MTPTSLDEIELRGAPLPEVRRRFRRPAVIPWAFISGVWGVQGLPPPGH